MSSATAPIVRALRPRDPEQQHRSATPLELFTDLCFVVAVAQAAAQFHHAVSDDHVGEGLLGFALAFFAIWWTWLNFTWFASAYDNDDVGYRVLTILQIVGSLVVAAGIPAVFEFEFTVVVIGYVIMRVALVGQWLRAARNDPARRVTCLRYAGGIAVVQLLWVVFLLLPPALVIPAFLIFVVAELLVPAFAERAAGTPWHAHHVAERYGLFYIIVLGEVILSVMNSIQEALQSPALETGAVGEPGHVQGPGAVLMIAASGLGIVFSLWWLYFSRSAAPILHRQHARGGNPFAWGYGHYLVFGATAAIGAGLEARIDLRTHHEHPPEIGSAAVITVAVATVLAMIWLLHISRHDRSVRTVLPFGIAIVAVLAATFTPYPEPIVAGICVLLLAVEIGVAGLVDSGD